MRMIEELKPLFLYPANRKFHIPISDIDKRHGAAILSLAPTLEITERLTRLPYVYNPKLYQAIYIDRNVMDFIDFQPDVTEKLKNDNGDIDELDEVEEAALSEALFGTLKSVKFKIDDDISILDRKYVEVVYNKKTTADIIKNLYLPTENLPDYIYVDIHPNFASLRDQVPNWLEKLYSGNGIYSYSKDNVIHVISKRVYDPDRMGGPYEQYLMNQLIYHMITACNENINPIIAMALAQYFSGVTDWRKKEKPDDFGSSKCNKLADQIRKLALAGVQTKLLRRYFRTGELEDFMLFFGMNARLKAFLNEDTLSYMDRQNLPDSAFGVPSKRKYPMPDPEHVLAAIRMFNNCDPDDEEELAHAIISKIKKFGMDPDKIGVSAANRFRPYWLKANLTSGDKKKDDKKDKDSNKLGDNKYANALKNGVKNITSKIGAKKDSKSKNESVEDILDESFIDSDYGDILHICDHLSPEEFKRVSFYDTYRDSPFVVKRIIHRVGMEPAGFLDLYWFPTKPSIAQITIAVDSRFRGQHIADSMVKELLASDIASKCDFDTYYWTVAPDNEASYNLACKNGFVDTGHIDKYGRKVLLRPTKSLDYSINDIPEDTRHAAGLLEGYSYIDNDMAILTEEVDSKTYNARLKRYLYKQRMKNNKAVLVQYDKIKAMNPDLKRTFLKIEKYRGFNMFVDFSYYHGLYLTNNKMKRDKAVALYFDFLMRCIHNKEIAANYKKRTIYIPVDPDVWNVVPGTDIGDFRINLNPISIILRLLRTNPDMLKKSLGKEQVLFVGTRGYFKVDFNKFAKKNVQRFKTNLRKLMSTTEPVVDDEEPDELGPDEDDEKAKNTDTPKARTAKMVDKIEKGTSIELNNISSAKDKKPEEDTNEDEPEPEPVQTPPLVIQTTPMVLGKEPGSIAIISIDPDGPDGFERLSNTVLANLGNVQAYCIVKNEKK